MFGLVENGKHSLPSFIFSKKNAMKEMECCMAYRLYPTKEK